MAAATDDPKVAVVVQLGVRGADPVRAMRARERCERDLAAGAVGHGRSRSGVILDLSMLRLLAIEGRRLRDNMARNIFRTVDSLTGNAPGRAVPQTSRPGFNQ